MSNFFKRAIRERRKFWNPDTQSESYHADWSNKERTYFSRNISFFISYALRDAPITPNQVTMFWVLLGSVGALFLACPHYGVSIVGIVMLYVSWILDNVDGELARYNKEFSDEGNFSDMVGHQTIFPLIFGSLTFLMYLQQESVWLIGVGLMATALITPMSKMQENVEHLRALDFIAREKEYLMPSALDNNPILAKEKEEKSAGIFDFVQKILGFLFTHCAMLYLLIASVAFAIEWVYLAFYGIGVTLLFIPKFFARKNELSRLNKEGSNFKDEIPPEWLDRDDS